MLSDMCFFRLSMFFFFKQKTAYEMRISDWSSDVCSSDLILTAGVQYATGQMTSEGGFDLALPDSLSGLSTALAGTKQAELTSAFTASLNSAAGSEARRVGKGCVRTCNTRWSP